MMARANGRQWAASTAIFVLGCALTISLAAWLRDYREARATERVRGEARALAERLEARLRSDAALLAAGAGMFEASESVDVAEWKQFVGALDIAGAHPGLRGLGFVRRETVVEPAGGSTGGSRDARRVRDVLTFIAPEDGHSKRALGSDLREDVARRAALEAAAGGGVAMSGPLAMRRIGSEVEEPGVLMARAIRAAGEDGTSTRSGQDVRGFVTGALTVSEVVRSVAGAHAPGYPFRIVDRGGITGGNTILFGSEDSDGIRGAAAPGHVYTFPFGGRIWAVEPLAPPGYGVEDLRMQEAGVTVGGILLSAMLAILALLIMRTRARAEHIAATMTRDLEAERHRFERMVAGSSDGVWEYAPASGEVYLSSRYMALLGHPAVDMRVTPDWVPRSIHPEERENVARAFMRAVRGRDIFDMRMRMRLTDGEYRWFRVRGRSFGGTDGEPLLVAGSLSDVHEDHEARMRESRLLRIIELSPDMFMTFDLEGRPTYLNPAARRVFGEIGAGRLSGASIASVFAQNEVDRVFNEGVPTAYMQDFWESETELITIDGEVMPVSQVILSHKTESGQVEFYSTVMRDISALRSALEDLRRTRERLQRALDGANDGIWESTIDTGAFHTSDRLAEMLSYSVECMPRTVDAWLALVHPDDLAISTAAVKRMLESDESVVWDTRLRTGTGEYRWMRRRGRAVRSPDGVVTAAAGTMSDIHDARVAEEALKELQARYSRVLDGSNDGIWEMDEVADAFYCSPRLGEIVGWSAESAPRTRAAVRDRIHPEDAAEHARAVEVMHRSVAAHCWDVRLRADDGSHRWLRFRGIASRDAAGRVVLCSGTASDVHEARLAEDELKRHRDNLAQLVEERTAGLEIARREAEAQRTRAEASRENAERANLAKSEFLANMSHELRTPMHAIISFANFGVDRHDRAERDKLLHYFRNIQKSGSRLLTLLNDLLDLSKLEAGKMQMDLASLQPAGLVAEAVGESEAFAQGRGVRLRVVAAGELGDVRWDGARLLQVLRNLISNAVKFSPAGAEVSIELRRTTVRMGRRADDPLVDGVEIRVRDAGIGIPEDELEAVFDKFVQSSKTKTGAGGTGLGLAICREIVLAHFGVIQAVNNPPPAGGATFVVCLPADPEAACLRSMEDQGVEA
jgi:PAS domain S-box-containing protein